MDAEPQEAERPFHSAWSPGSRRVKKLSRRVKDFEHTTCVDCAFPYSSG